MRKTVAALFAGALLALPAAPAIAAGNTGTPEGNAYGNCKHSAGGGAPLTTQDDPATPWVENGSLPDPYEPTAENGYGGYIGKYKHSDGCVADAPDDGGGDGSGDGTGGDGSGGTDGPAS